MKWLLFYINILLIIIVTILSYFLHSYGTDYEEYNELYKCINNPSLCPLEISIYNFSYAERVFMKMTSWIGSFFLVELSVIYFTIFQLYILAKNQKMNFIFIFVGFFLAFLKDYYLNAFAQAVSLTLFICSFNVASKMKSFILKFISAALHPSAILYFLKVGKRIQPIFYIIIALNVILFIMDRSLLLYFVENLLSVDSIGAGKLFRYIEEKSMNEGILPFLIKAAIFLFVCESNYMKDSPQKSIYILVFVLYTAFLSIDIVANRILAVSKIFEILAFASLLRTPFNTGKYTFSFIYLAILFTINFR